MICLDMYKYLWYCRLFNGYDIIDKVLFIDRYIRVLYIGEG